MERGLSTWFAENLPDAGTGKVEYELLREGPTQTGVGFPKFYVWVRVVERNRTLVEGAARVAAVDGSALEVTHFLTQDEILSRPMSASEVFPAALNAKILQFARDGHAPRTK